MFVINIQLRFYCVKHINVFRTSAGICLIPTVDKIGDAKCGAAAKNALTCMSEATGMPWVADQVGSSSFSLSKRRATEVANNVD